MESKLLKFSLVCVTGAFVLAANPITAYAYEEGVAGFTYDKISIRSEKDSSSITTLSSDEIPVPGFSDIGIADVETNLLVRSGPGEDKKIVGKLPKNAGCDIIKEDAGNGWTKISSGKVSGYVKTKYLITGTQASKLALKVGDYIATANTNGLRVRKEPSVDAEVLDQVARGEELIVLEGAVPNYDEEHKKWVKVSLDSDESEEGTIGYVAKEYVDLSYQLKKALSIEELNFGSEVSSVRIRLVNKAKEYLGGRYRYGTSVLGVSVDCSGFTQQIYKKFGYSIPRDSRSQGSSGTNISSSQLKPGDLVFYGNGGRISHVAIFIGNGKIIHASNRRDGIKISNLYYRQPIKYVRYIKG
ncbi:MAG: peptidoglycan endopeptidase [Lachnospiraceae bacterium]|nr:peptidoglycan endopeptidase [Lachnospiraceae bacterium]